MITGNESAMPFSETVEYREDRIGNMCPIQETSPGLTILQHFAAMFTAAYIARGVDGDTAAKDGVIVANNLISELNKPIK